MCFNVDNGIYDSGIRLRKGYLSTSSTSVQYIYYSSGICVSLTSAYSDYMNGRLRSFSSSFKFDNEKYGTKTGHLIYASVNKNGRVAFSFDVEQESDYNSNYASSTNKSMYEIKGTKYYMWGKIYYE